MSIADKIILLRRKNGWSQEELAEKMQVSRQAVSKWESGQSAPDLSKLLTLSDLFGVSTDYLLRDALEKPDVNEKPAPAGKRITLRQAAEFLDSRKKAAVWIAAGTFLCILGVVFLIVMGALSEVPAFPLTEDAAGVLGMVGLLVLVAAAVGLFVTCGFRNAPYEFLERKPFETETGVAPMVRERQRDFRPAYVRYNVVATCLCVLSPIPLFVGALMKQELLMVIMLTITIVLAGIGAVLFILAGVPWAGMQKLLKEGDYAGKKGNRVKEAVSSAYWLITTALYLAVSFHSNSWHTTWVVWPVAGLLFGAVSGLCNLLPDREKT